jgi:protein-S-isoprenylcysteine O-methyltransferase Ste14
MTDRRIGTGSLLFLAVVFTAGLTFATVELPALLDRFLHDTIATPTGDSHADEISRLKTQLFMAHYHIRAAGYGAFFLLTSLIMVGFGTKRTGLAALGGLGVMLPVFAQFAGVMFFLAGLGILNAIWLPILDISYELQNWGLVIDLPNDLLRWILGMAGVSSPWPTILLFIGSGILVFLLSTYAWLNARAREGGIATSRVYRISRHPQYLGWILWTYGAYLLLGLAHYPKRSWGIGASLPWLISTLVIVAVALVEEVRMRDDYGEAYEVYRRRAPFLLPLPSWLGRALAAPFRLLFGKERPERVREVVAVVGLYGVLLVGVSALFRGGGLERAALRLASPETRSERMEARVAEAATASDLHAHRYYLLDEIASFGEPALQPLTALLHTEDARLRALVAEVLGKHPGNGVVPALETALADPNEEVRHKAALALAAAGAPAARPALLARLENPEGDVRLDVFEALAALGDEEILGHASALLSAEGWWNRTAALSALGALGSEQGLPLAAAALEDPEARVRRDAVIALLRIGSPAARPALERASHDPDFEVRVYAAEALKRL